MAEHTIEDLNNNEDQSQCGSNSKGLAEIRGRMGMRCFVWVIVDHCDGMADKTICCVTAALRESIRQRFSIGHASASIRSLIGLGFLMGKTSGSRTSFVAMSDGAA
jgi:hypothetical protein